MDSLRYGLSEAPAIVWREGLAQPPPRAVAFLYPDNTVAVLRVEEEDGANPGFVSRLEFTIPFQDPMGDIVEMPWPDVADLGKKKIRDRIAILPDGRWGSRGKCRSCEAEVVFVRNPSSGKTPPYELDGTSHFDVCPDASRWRTGGRATAS